MKSGQNESSPLIASNSLISSIQSSIGDVALISSPELSYRDAGLKISRLAFPLTLSRVTSVVYVLTNGYIIANISSDAAAAGPTLISLFYAIMDPCRAIIGATGIFVGKKNGEVLALRAANNDVLVKEVQKEIGSQLKQSHVLATLLGIPSMALMLSMKPILESAGMAPEVALEIKGFFDAISIGILPIYWLTADQQFAMGIGYRKIPIIFGTLFSALAMMVGYPLALGMFGLPNKGTAGLGYGISIAGWLSFLGLRSYFLKQEFTPYSMFTLQTQGLMNQFFGLIKLGLPLGFQGITGWGNMFALSVLIARRGNNVLVAANPSFQIITAATLLTAGFGQGIGIKIAESLGQIKAINNLLVLKQNILRLGNAGIIIGTSVMTGFVVVLVSIPRQTQSIYIKKDSPDYESTMVLAQAMLFTNALGLIFDTIRSLASSSLTGSKDVFFAPMISMIMMSIISLSTGALLTEYFDLNPNWLFITRDAGILLSALAISMRWLNKDYSRNPSDKIPITASNIHSFFCCSKSSAAAAGVGPVEATPGLNV